VVAPQSWVISTKNDVSALWGQCWHWEGDDSKCPPNFGWGPLDHGGCLWLANTGAAPEDMAARYVAGGQADDGDAGEAVVKREDRARPTKAPQAGPAKPPQPPPPPVSANAKVPQPPKTPPPASVRLQKKQRSGMAQAGDSLGITGLPARDPDELRQAVDQMLRDAMEDVGNVKDEKHKKVVKGPQTHDKNGKKRGGWYNRGQLICEAILSDNLDLARELAAKFYHGDGDY
jgi:hypothetical protein